MAPNFAERIKPVDPKRFSFAFGVYCAAAALKGPAPNPQEFGLTLVDGEEGSGTRITFADRPENRGMLAVKKEFPDKTEFQSMGFRIMTFSELVQDRKLRKWGLITDNNDTGLVEIHEAVLHALAQAPFRKSGTLDRPAFLELVKSECERMDAEEAGEASAA
jgi:hypothetical protein